MISPLEAEVNEWFVEEVLDPTGLLGLEGSELGTEPDCKERRASAELE